MMTTDTNLMKMADSKSQVSGTYYGIEYTGTAVSSRQITTRPYREEITIELDEAINVLGDNNRTVLLISADQIENKTHSIS